jgi:hypothetical protein
MNLETEVVLAIKRAHKYLPREDLHDLARAAIDAYRNFEERELAARLGQRGSLRILGITYSWQQLSPR